jgi:hypothetical protein
MACLKTFKNPLKKAGQSPAFLILVAIRSKLLATVSRARAMAFTRIFAIAAIAFARIFAFTCMLLFAIGSFAIGFFHLGVIFTIAARFTVLTGKGWCSSHHRSSEQAQKCSGS